jgi:hypothetical protein
LVLKKWNCSSRSETIAAHHHVAAIRELYKVKEKPVINQESTELNDESLGTVVQAESRDVSKVSSLQQQEGKGPQPLIEESQSTFLQGADDEFFDAEESSREHEVDSELQYSSESEGTFDETDQKKQVALSFSASQPLRCYLGLGFSFHFILDTKTDAKLSLILNLGWRRRSEDTCSCNLQEASS